MPSILETLVPAGLLSCAGTSPSCGTDRRDAPGDRCFRPYVAVTTDSGGRSAPAFP